MADTLRLWALRVLWVGLAVLTLVTTVAAVGPRYQNLATVSTEPTGLGDLTPADAADLAAVGISHTYYAIHFTVLETGTAVAFFIVGTVIFVARRSDPTGMTVALMLVAFGTNASPLLDSLAVLRPGWEVPVTLMRMVGLTGAVFIFYIFPDGRFVPRWARWLALPWAVYILLVPFAPGVNPVVRIVFNDPIEGLNFVLMGLLLGGSFIAMLHRYRAASTQAQQVQIRWIVYAGIVGMAISLTVSLPTIIFAGAVTSVSLFAAFTAILLSQYLMAASVGVAIVRHRLFDIDIIIRRTVTYALLTAVLSAVYGGLVLVIQNAFRLASGQQSTIALVLSTLAIAALFNPVRQRIQQTVDRRFHRSPYDAQAVLDAFSASLHEELNPQQVQDELVATVNTTLQPEHISVTLLTDERTTSP